MPASGSPRPRVQLWRRSVQLTTAWALLLIFLFVAVVLSRTAVELEGGLLGRHFMGLSLAQILTALNLSLGVYLAWDLRRAWRMRGPLRRGHVAGVVLAILLVAVLHVGIGVVSDVVKRLASA